MMSVGLPRVVPISELETIDAILEKRTLILSSNRWQAARSEKRNLSRFCRVP